MSCKPTPAAHADPLFSFGTLWRHYLEEHVTAEHTDRQIGKPVMRYLERSEHAEFFKAFNSRNMIFRKIEND